MITQPLACQTVAASVATTWPAHLAAQANSVVRANMAVEKLLRRATYAGVPMPTPEQRAATYTAAIVDMVLRTDRRVAS